MKMATAACATCRSRQGKAPCRAKAVAHPSTGDPGPHGRGFLPHIVARQRKLVCRCPPGRRIGTPRRGRSQELKAHGGRMASQAPVSSARLGPGAPSRCPFPMDANPLRTCVCNSLRAPHCVAARQRASRCAATRLFSLEFLCMLAPGARPLCAPPRPRHTEASGNAGRQLSGDQDRPGT